MLQPLDTPPVPQRKSQRLQPPRLPQPRAALERELHPRRTRQETRQRLPAPAPWMMIGQSGRLHQLARCALAQNSQRTYSRVWHRLVSFAATRGHPPLPLSRNQTEDFVAHLYDEGLAPATMRCYVAAIAYFHKLNGFPDFRDAFVIGRALAGAARLARTPAQREPMSLRLLRRLTEQCAVVYTSDHDKALYPAMFLVAFYALCRVSEIAVGRFTDHTLQRRDVARLTGADAFRITFRSFKHARGPQRVRINKQLPAASCPVAALDRYLRMRGETQGPLFLHRDGRPVACREFQSALASLLRSLGERGRLSSHSFRIGGATHAARAGLSAVAIQRLGRWRSNAFMRYIRL